MTYSVTEQQRALGAVIAFARRHLDSNEADAEAFAPGDRHSQMAHRVAGLTKTLQLLLEAAEPLTAPIPAPTARQREDASCTKSPSQGPSD
ncbi:hypothetical protein [Streptomyces niger]|uniref:hypothetical protein n=1 Tax=Streptomyces niger TaxID=66373 RepID=UPI0018FEEF58|nr:hypothetical protein [Streptomyces niger]